MCYKELINRFLVNMVYAFQDRENLYLIMDLMIGGDLRYHLTRKKTFTEEQTSNIRRYLDVIKIFIKNL